MNLDTDTLKKWLPWILLVLLVLGKSGGAVGGKSPIPDAGFRCVIVEETADRQKLPRPQLDILTATVDGSVVAFLKNNAVEWRIVDKDADMSLDSKPIAAMFARPRTSIPWLVTGNGRSGFEGPLPANATDALKILEPLAK